MLQVRLLKNIGFKRLYVYSGHLTKGQHEIPMRLTVALLTYNRRQCIHFTLLEGYLRSAPMCKYIWACVCICVPAFSCKRRDQRYTYPCLTNK